MVRRGTFLRIFAALVALAAGAAVAGNVVVLREGDRRVRAPGDVPESDAIVVLGAGVRPDGAPSDMLADRLETALGLYQAGRAPRILVSGDHGHDSYDEPGAMRTWLEARGVPAEAVVMDHAGFDTYSTMWRAKNVFDVGRAVVVTQAFHLPRALFLAARLGLDATGVVADRRPYRGILWSELRETASRPKAWLDAATSRTPRFSRADAVSLTSPTDTAPPR